MNTIKVLGLTVRNRVVGLAMRNIDTTKYEPLKELIWNYLVKDEADTLCAQDNEDFYHKLAFWRNEVVDDKVNLLIDFSTLDAFTRLERSIEDLMEQIPCNANYVIKESFTC
nr:MAG TPA: hypothetical protein [Caudoviricetes sp.]